MSEKGQDFRGLSTLLLGNHAERPGKHLLLTSSFSLWTSISLWVYGPGKDPALRAKKQSVRIKPFNHIALIEGGTGIKVLWHRE